jgi:hypothetical protein
MKTLDWKSTNPKILLIGHDPRLQKSHTIAGYALFADYYFKSIPSSQSELQKYNLAKATFDKILSLTNGKYDAEDVYITNLCNDELEHAPKGKTVLIPKSKAEEGLEHIKSILSENPSIEYIFPMSLQVNYWLQKLNFYNSGDDFLEKSEPKTRGLESELPYYSPRQGRTFLSICGKRYKITGGSQFLIPILHVKNYPLKSHFLAYESSYQLVQDYF